MRHKYGKFYADWRDSAGVRHMKAFPTKKKAEAYAEQQRLAAHAKKASGRARRRRSRVSGSRRSRGTTTTAKS
jgi:hypothetical protein